VTYRVELDPYTSRIDMGQFQRLFREFINSAFSFFWYFDQQCLALLYREALCIRSSMLRPPPLVGCYLDYYILLLSYY